MVSRAPRGDSHNGVGCSGFLECALCNQLIEHPALTEAIKPWKQLKEKVEKAAVSRLRAEKLERAPELRAGGKWHGQPTGFAMDRYCFFQCFKCKQPYFAGAARCNAQAEPGERDKLVSP